MAQLTTGKYWDEVYRRCHRDAGNSLSAWFKRRIKSLLGSQIKLFSRNYSDYVLWERIYPAYLPVSQNAEVLEIGSAPGDYLVRLHRSFGWDTYGVDYAEAAATQNKQIFQAAGINPQQVIFSDAFGPDFQTAYQQRFDVVFSRGVIEHFTDFKGPLEGHWGVLKPGGLAVISIPNYRGLNYFMKLIFDRASLRVHNTDIMRMQAFSQLFENQGMETQFCGYYGTSDLGMFLTPHRWLKPAYQVCDKVQVLLNGIYRICFGDRGPESRYTSPFLLYIGRKK